MTGKYSRVEIIGDCTLYLGDCREILPSLPKVDAVITDIPYQCSQKSGGLRDIDFGEWDGEGSSKDAFEAMNLLVGVPSVLAFCEYRQLSKMYETFDGRSSRTVGWVKSNPTVMNGQHLFLPALEVGYYGKLPGAYFGGNCVKSVWQGTAPQDREHPTQKPIALMEWAVINTSKARSNVLYPFMGSGTTGVACANLDRSFYGIEREPKYFEIACKRIEAAYAQGRLFA